jgi:hypothetical protein
MTETKRQLCRTCVGPDECDLWHICHPGVTERPATQRKKTKQPQPKREYPVVKCLPRPDFVGGLMFYCPFCKTLHAHGRGNGHRVSHCTNPESPLYEHGYIVKMMSKAELREVAIGIKKYLEWQRK